ncbi:MAG: Ig-like domain-containing protein [Gemmatimonadota bacterium]|nr:Ig-like domain-containing protein [Gemmatimonadota bacterium]
MDAPTGPGHGRGGPISLRLAPSFSAATAAAYDGLGAFGLTVDNVHIHIDHPPAPAFDTVVVVAPGADSITLDLPVVLNSPTEVLNVQIELRDGTQVLFSGTQTVTASVGSTSVTPAPSIPIVYVGPGAGATHFAIAPRDTTIRLSGSGQFRFAATDDGGAAVSGVTVAWRVADPTLGTISAAGLFTPAGREGRTYVVGLTPNALHDSTTITVTAPPTQLVLVAGGGQTGPAGSALAQPLVVEARTAAGTPVPGVNVTFAGPATGGVAPASAMTGLDGRAQTAATLGHTVGAQNFTAAAQGLTGATATATATPAAPTVLARVSGDAQIDSAHAALPHPFVVRVTDAYGNAVGGATVDWVRIAGRGTLAAASTVADSTGATAVSYTLGDSAGTDTVSATIHGVPASAVRFTATVAERPASMVVVSGDGQSGTVGTALANPFVARVLDTHGHGIAGVPAAWTVTVGGGTVSPASSVSDSTGAVQTTLTLGPRTGLNGVQAAAGAGITLTFDATAAAGAATAIAKVAGDGQTAGAAKAVAVKPAVRLTDAHGNDVAGSTVTFAVAAGGGSVTGANATTDVTGLATVGGWTLGASGAQTLTATSGSLSTSFTATVSGAAAAVGTTALNAHVDTLTALSDTYQFTAQARDTASNPVAGAFTWASRAPATATVSTSGLVTAVANGSTWVVATDTNGTRDSAQVVVQQRVATVLVTPAVRNIYLTRNFALAAQAVDGRGHPMPGTPTFTWASNAPAVASVDTAGRVTGLGLGSAQISATTGGVTGVATISILTPITRIAVGRDSLGTPVTDSTALAALGRTRTFRALAYDTANAPMTGVTFTWTSTNGSVAVLDSLTSVTARATAAANGLTAITATAQGVSGSATLSVSQVQASVVVTPAADTIAVSGSAQLTARALDANTRYVAGAAGFRFHSLQPSTAAVDSVTGVVTGVANGTAFITASLGALTSNQVQVVVGGTVPATLSFGRDTLSVGRGSSVSVPIYLSKPSASPVTVHLTVADTSAYWTNANVTIAAGQTAVNATLNGHNAATTTVTATDSSGTGYGTTSAVLAVQATMQMAASSYALNVTDQTSTQVKLSDPSPAGGTYVAFSFGTAGVATVSPNPAFIPAGQLAADVQITAADSGTTTITPAAIGVNGTSATLQAYGAWLRFAATTDRMGAGQYNPSNNYVYVPTYNNLPITVSLTSSDTTIVRVPAQVTIPGGSYYAYFSTTGVAPGAATVTAQASGWHTTNSVAVTVTSPKVGVCCGNVGLVTTAPTQYLTVYSEDSLGYAHYRTNSLVVRLHSTDTTVMRVIDSVVTIPPGAYYLSSARVAPAGLGGTAYIVATASGHTADSAVFNVTGPKLHAYLYTGRVGKGQQDGNSYIQIPNAVATNLIIGLTSRDSTIAAVPATVTIPAGSTYSYFTTRGMGLGSTTIVASLPGYQSDSGAYTVTTPKLQLYGGATINNFGPRRTLTVYVEDSTGYTHYPISPLTVSLVSRDTTKMRVDSTVVTIPTSVYYSSAAGATPFDTGTTRIVASAPGYTSDSTGFTVQVPKLNFTFSTYYLGKGEHRQPTDFYVYTPDYRPSPLAVTLTQRHPTVDSLTGTPLTVPASSNVAYFSFYGLGQGADTLIAAAAGYYSDTAIVVVNTPKLYAQGIPTTATTTSPPLTSYVYAQDSTGGYQYPTDTLVIAAVSSDTTVLRPAQPYFRMPAGQYYTYTTLNVVGPGTASITYSDSAGTGFLPSTTNTVTITGPSLTFSSSSTTLGMRQTTGSSGMYVYIPNALASPLTVNLASTDPRVATAPATLTIPAGSNYVYFGITAADTVGTIQIQATATGYGGTTTQVQVTQPKFAISTSSQLNTTSAPATIWVAAQDANGNSHYTAENVAVTMSSSSPSVAGVDSTTVTIPAGQYQTYAAHWAPGVVGTAQLSASDARAAYYRYNAATYNVSVVNPALSMNWASTPLGIGQYIDYNYVSRPDAPASALTVTLTQGATPHASTSPGSPMTIAAGTTTTPYFRLIGLSAGTDTIVASAASPYHKPDTAYTVVGQGRIDPLSGWPTALTAGDSAAITLYVRDPAQNYRFVLANTTFTLAPNANIEFHLGGAAVTSVTVPAGAQSVTFFVKALSAGTASATITATNYLSYTNTFTVNP